MTIEALTNESYEKFLAEREVALVLFYARWEHYHPILRPLLEAAATEFNGRVNVGDVDVDACMDLAASVRIKNVPTVIYYGGGTLVESVIGVEPNQNLLERVRSMLAGAPITTHSTGLAR